MNKLFYVWGVVFLSLSLRGFAEESANKWDASVSEVFNRFAPAAYDQVSESVDPFRGSLGVRLLLLHLPGKGGLDLTLQAVYNSSIVVDGRCSLQDPYDGGGGGWQIHFGHLFNPDGTGSYLDPNIKEGDADTIDGPDLAVRDNPWFVDAGGASHVFYRKGDGSLVSVDRWTLEKVNSSYIVTDRSGTRYTCDGSDSF